jgi:hypothetical protein
MDLNDQDFAVRILLRDHDAKFTASFDEVFCSEGAEVIRTPIRAPKANAYAERWVQTIRAECLDWTLVLAGTICSGCCAATFATTTSSDHTAASPWPSPNLRRGNRPRRRSTLERCGVAMCSAASSTSITRSQHDGFRVSAPHRQTAAMRPRHPHPLPPTGSAFAGFCLPPEVIVLAVRWYLRFALSDRDVEEVLAERGVQVDHVTVYRWVLRFTPLLAEAARPCRHAVGSRWQVDET